VSASKPVVGRLAPSPTGVLHIGNARSILAAWLSARASGGRVYLRIEDLLPGQAERVTSVLDDLAFLGLDWDEPPPDKSRCDTSDFDSDLNVNAGFWLQSQRAVAHANLLGDLIVAGRVYPCVCTRKDIERALRAPHAEDKGSAYPGTCRGRFADIPAAVRHEAAESLRQGRRPVGVALRLRVGAVCGGGVVRFHDEFAGERSVDLTRDSGDLVVRRKDGTHAYMFAVVADDIAMGVTEVVRGDDLLDCTAQQIAVADALAKHVTDEAISKLARGNQPRFVHVPLVYGDDGRRLAKRNKSLHLGTIREQGIAAERVLRWLAASLGVGDCADLRQMAENFRWDKVSRRSVAFGDVEMAAMIAGGEYSPIVRFLS